MITILQPGLSAIRQGGILSAELFRWLNGIREALHGPFIGQMATGSKVIKDGEYGLHAEELILRGSEEIVIEGDGILVVV